jgi:hypothetical protein
MIIFKVKKIRTKFTINPGKVSTNWSCIQKIGVKIGVRLMMIPLIAYNLSYILLISLI